MAAGVCSDGSSLDLHWIPLGAGTHFVRLNGILYEALRAFVERRPRHGLYHSVLRITLPHGTYWVEMTPVPDARGVERGVVATGPVGLRHLQSLRLFRYEVRRWRDGVVPDLGYTVGTPLRLSTDPDVVAGAFEALPDVPRLTWGRDELGVQDMWSCNSITSWCLAQVGIDPSTVRPPPNGRAPGWHAGVAASGWETEPRPWVWGSSRSPTPR